MPRSRSILQIGKPLFGPLAGCQGARHCTYRVVNRIAENSRVVHVLDIGHRSEIYAARWRWNIVYFTKLSIPHPTQRQAGELPVAGISKPVRPDASVA